MAAPADRLEAVVRAEWPMVVATLLRSTGEWELAEDCAQDAAERALRTWPRDGVPERPGAWLTTVARRRALDVLRRRTSEGSALRAWTAQTLGRPPTADEGGGYADDRLRLLVTCCHPGLGLPDRVALTLRSVCGLTTREVADLMLVGEAAMSQRLLRARRRIQRDGLVLAVPPADQVHDRVDAVLAVVYLLFTEGWTATEGQGLRDEVAEEAVTLTALVTRLLPDHGEAHALRALLLLQHARRPARTTGGGELVPLEEQDRGRWDTALLAAGLAALRRARAAPDAVDGLVGVYRPQAEVAALHASASSAQDTDWAGIVAWYDVLLQGTGSPVVALNRAVALGLRDGPAAGLRALEEVVQDHALTADPGAAAARADLLRRAGDRAGAHAAYRTALELARTEAVRGHLRRRLDGLGPPPA